MLADFVVSIDHGQVVVHGEGEPGAGLLWTDEHVAQGFAWSEKLLTLGVPDHDGECRIQVELVPEATVSAQALWAVQMPLEVTQPLHVGALFERHRVGVPNGRYALLYQALPGTQGEAYVLRLSLAATPQPAFRILRTGGDVTADAVLRRDAQLLG